MAHNRNHKSQYPLILRYLVATLHHAFAILPTTLLRFGAMKFYTNNKVVVVVVMVGTAVTIHSNLHMTSLVRLGTEQETSGKVVAMDDVIPTIDSLHTIATQQEYIHSSTGMLSDEKPTETQKNTTVASMTVNTVIDSSFTNDDRRHSIWKYPLPPNNPQKKQQQQQQQEEEHRQHSRAIVLLSMGPGAAESTLVERCVISIRFRGRFQGPILLLTDASADRFALLTQEDDQLVLMHPLLPDWNFALKRDLPYKRFKTYILSYLERDDRLQHVSLAYYLDFDLVVGQDLQPWFDHVESQYFIHRPTGSDENIESPPSSLEASEFVLFEGNVSPLQGGQFVVQKGRSEGCLKRWRTYMDADVDEHKDQVSLTKMWNDQQFRQTQHGNRKKSKNSHCILHRMAQKPYLSFLSSKEMASLQSGENGPNAVVYPTLMHIKNTHHAQLIPENIQREFYQNLLQLPSHLIQNITAKKRIRPNRTWTEEQVKRGYS